jgi:hypothetical protein
VARNDGEEERVTFPWPEPAAPLRVTVTWRFTDEAAIPIAIEVRTTGGEPITARVWRTIRVQEVIGASRRRLSTELQALRLDEHVWTPEEIEAAGGRQAVQELRRPGRPRHHTDEFLAEVAGVYADAAAHHSRRPVREVAEHFASKGVSDAPTAAKGWVSEARHRGLIPRKES